MLEAIIVIQIIIFIQNWANAHNNTVNQQILDRAIKNIIHGAKTNKR